MRRFLVVAVALVATLGFMAAPAQAQAPAPKVTINGLVDFVATYYQNWTGGNINAEGPTTREDGFYSRERGVFTITGEIGRAKGVLALEFDVTNGFISGTGGSGGCSAGAPGTSAGADLDGDCAGISEVKWLYVEAPITGPGSMMPFIPASGIIRGGLQPARGHDYKVGILLSGDFPGVTWESQWAPNVKSTLSWVQITEGLDGLAAGTDNESYAIVASVEIGVFKGLTVKPTYAFARFDGGNTGTSALGLPPVGGFVPTGTRLQTHRHTIGGDVRWTSGPFSVQPTFYYQFGEQECIAGVGIDIPCAVTEDVDISAFIVDVTGGFRTGPLNIEGRIMYTSGMKADEFVQAGDEVGYYTPINPAFAYLAGWSEIWTSGIDYATAYLAGAPGVSARTSPSYDKYGRIFAGLAVDYALTPALTLRGLLNSSWTAEEVDTSGVILSTGLDAPDGNGDARWLGVEAALGLTYRFAPNVALDLIAATLQGGDARDEGFGDGDAKEVYKGVARVRVTW